MQQAEWQLRAPEISRRIDIGFLRPQLGYDLHNWNSVAWIRLRNSQLLGESARFVVSLAWLRPPPAESMRSSSRLFYAEYSNRMLVVCILEDISYPWRLYYGDSCLDSKPTRLLASVELFRFLGPSNGPSCEETLAFRAGPLEDEE